LEEQFKEALGKAIRSLEIGSYGLEEIESSYEEIIWRLKNPTAERIWYIAEAIRRGFSIGEIYEFSRIDPWFLNNIKEVVEIENKLKQIDIFSMHQDELKEILFIAKQNGLSDKRIASLTGNKEEEIRLIMENGNDFHALKIFWMMLLTFQLSGFYSRRPYFYST